MKIYISGPLKVLSNREKTYAFYDFLASICKQMGFEPYLPHQRSDPIIHKNLSFNQVFQMDFESLNDAEIILAVINEPSTGMGAEIGIALERKKNVIAIYDKKNDPSRFILGLLENSHAKIISYSDKEDCKRQLENSLKIEKLESIYCNPQTD